MLHPLIFLTTFLSANVSADDLGDHADFAHAMDIETRLIDDFPVVFHYSEIRPDFNPQPQTPYRQTLALDGPWQFRFDPENLGLTEHWHSRELDKNWQKVTVPHCWDTMPGARFWDWSDWSPSNPPFYNGAAWYRRDFDFQNTVSPHHRLQFLGVQQRARIFLNGVLVATHEGGGQPFSVNVSEHIRAGNNTIAVQVIRLPNFKRNPGGRVQEISNTHTQHPKAPDNWPYAGITRSISIISEPLVTIRKTQIRVLDRTLEIAVCLQAPSDLNETHTLHLSSPAIPQALRKEFTFADRRHRVLRFKTPLNSDAERWSPENPHLYKLKTTLSKNDVVFDRLESNFGIRDYEIKGSNFQLNGQPIFLKGVAFYEEHDQRGSALLAEDHEQLFKLLQSAHANFARLHLSQRHPYTYELADKLGIMLCAEWGGFWYKEKSMAAQSADSQSIYQSHARCAIWDLMNHPSIVLWGLHNESHQFCPEYERFVSTARALTQELDWTQRPMTWAAWHPHKGQPKFQYADAVGFNEYRGAMDPFEELAPDLKKTIRQNPHKPLIIMENGGWSTLGKRGSPEQKGTEDWQANLMRKQYEVLSEFTPPLSGYTYWLLKDYRSRKQYTGNRRQNGWSRMGLYSHDGKPKLVRDVFKNETWNTSNSSR